MLIKILSVIAVLIVIFAIIVALQPDNFSITRSASMAAKPDAIFAQINDFHKWEKWSPWAKLDPVAQNTFAGPTSGTGAIFKWSGNHNVGAGMMTITESRPSDLILIKLEFYKPLKGINTTEFSFKPQGDQTLVTWTMSGKSNFIAKAMSLIMNCDKMVGGQFEQGLAAIKTIVETESKIK